MATDFSSSVFSIEHDGHVATLWLDREEARNAMGPDFWRDLPVAMAALDADEEIRAIVIAAKGPHFSVGLDLKAMGGSLMGTGNSDGAPSSSATKNAALYRQIRSMQASVTAVADCSKPVIAAIHGYCIGGGVDLIAACDVRLSSFDAVYSVREAKVAIVADIGSLQRLPAIIGIGHVNELALTGKDITAERAAAIGLVNDAEGSPAEVVRRARAMAAEIASNSPLAVQGTKAVLAASASKSVEDGLEFVATWNALYINSNDLVEAMTSFVEKRQGNYTGT
jgi:enoyl-CoA hydratase